MSRLEDITGELPGGHSVELVLEKHEQMAPRFELGEVRELLLGADREHSRGPVDRRGGGGRFVVD